MSQLDAQVLQAVTAIKQDGLIAYPTEAVFGLGCDFRSEKAVNRLLTLKKRPIEKGLILIASHIQQILPLIKIRDQNHLAVALKTWPGHNTWVFKKSEQVPEWISGSHDTVAVRVSAHPTVKALCDALDTAIVSSSANSAGEQPFVEISKLQSHFKQQIDFYLDQPLGNMNSPSKIRLSHNQQLIR